MGEKRQVRLQIKRWGFKLTYLETAGGSATTSTLELATLGADERLGVASGDTGGTEVLDGLTGVLRTTEQDGVLTSRSTESKLVKGQNFTTSVDDTGTSGLGDTEGGNGHLGDIEETDVVGDGTNNNGDLVLVSLQVASNAGDGHGRAVGTGLEETLQDDLVELRVGTTSQESVKLLMSKMTISQLSFQHECDGCVY
jgi:hypothetical protein